MPHLLTSPSVVYAAFNLAGLPLLCLVGMFHYRLVRRELLPDWEEHRKQARRYAEERKHFRWCLEFLAAFLGGLVIVSPVLLVLYELARWTPTA